MQPSFVSPRYRNVDIPQPLTVEVALSILEDQVNGWFFDVAQRCTKDLAADFVVLMVVTSYFETYEILRSGKNSEGQSRRFFRQGFQDFLESATKHHSNALGQVVVDEFTDALYKQLRCGLFHVGMTRQIGLSRSFLSNLSENAFLMVSQETDGSYHFMINAPQMLVAVQKHFGSFLNQLRNPNNVDERARFKAGWNIRVSRADGSPSELTIP